MTYFLYGQLEQAHEEADKEKALKQVANSNLQDKILELAQMEQRANATGKARDVAKQKVRLLEGNLKESKVKIAEMKSMVSTQDNETVDLKEIMKNNEQNFYDRRFNDAEHLSQLVVFESCRMLHGRMDGYGRCSQPA